MYSKETIKRFQKPKFVGEIKAPDAVGQEGNIKCLLPDEKIFINQNFSEIKNAEKGNVVFSHDLKNNIIYKKFFRMHKKNIITLQNSLGKVSITPEHLVYAIKLPKHQKYFRNKHKKELVPAWYHAGDLKNRDIVLYPVYNKIKDEKYIQFDIPKSKWDFKSNKIPKKIPLNNDFLRLCGYFLAEGHISESKCNNCIQLAFNINEKEYSEDVRAIVKKLFDINVTQRIEKSRNTLKVYIYSAGLARFFKKLFNKGAENKKIPDMMINLPIDKQASLLEGLWKGDGYVNLSRIGPRAGFATISYNLAQQVKLMLLRQNIAPSIYIDKEKTVKGVHHKKAYRIHIGQRDSLIRLCNILKMRYNPRSYKSIDSWFDNGFLYTPITNIKKIRYKGLVCNIEVDKAHSFISEAFCLHNCGDIMKIFLKVDPKTEKIKDIKFQTYGCVAAIAASDAMCEIAKGKTLKQASEIPYNQIVKKLGNLPLIKVHCSVLGTKALKNAIKNYEERKRCLNKK